MLRGIQCLQNNNSAKVAYSKRTCATPSTSFITQHYPSVVHLFFSFSKYEVKLMNFAAAKLRNEILQDSTLSVHSKRQRRLNFDFKIHDGGRPL